MKEGFGQMLSYEFNHELTETERNEIISGLEKIWCKSGW